MKNFRLIFFAIACLLAGCGRNSNSYLDALRLAELVPEPVRLIAENFPNNELQVKPYYVETATEVTQAQIKPDTDIIFTIDNSGSMDPFIEAVANNLDNFVNQLINTRTNFRLGFLKSTEDTNGQYSNDLVGPYPVIQAGEANIVSRAAANIDFIRNAHHGSQEIGVGIILRSLDNLKRRSFFRSTAAQVYIVLTDAEDLDYTAGNFSLASALQMFQSLSGNVWTTIGIGSPYQNQCTDAENPDQTFLNELVLASGGLMGSICSTNYSSLMSQAVQKIRTLLTEFSLTNSYTDLEDIQVSVHGQNIPNNAQNGFIYSPARGTIAFPGSYVPAAGETITITVLWKEE